MRKLVHIYPGKAIAEPANEAGGKHAMLVFVAIYSDNYDCKAAQTVAAERGWRDVEFSKAGKVTREHIQQQDRYVKACFEEALASGASMLAYAEVEQQ